mgnify:CR=1 FL=1
MSIIDQSNLETHDKPPRPSLPAATMFWVQQCHQRLRTAILQEFREQEITLSAAQWDLLSVLWQRDGLSQTELADSSGRDKAGITRLIDGLEDLALVERRRPPGNRRRYAIHLTAQGRSLHKRLLPIAEQVSERALAGLSDEDRRALHDSLRLIHGNLHTATKGK